MYLYLQSKPETSNVAYDLHEQCNPGNAKLNKIVHAKATMSLIDDGRCDIITSANCYFPGEFGVLFPFSWVCP